MLILYLTSERTHTQERQTTKKQDQTILHSLLKNFPPAIQLVFFSMHFNLSVPYNNLINYIFNFIWLSLFDRVLETIDTIHTNTKYIAECGREMWESDRQRTVSNGFLVCSAFQINWGSLKSYISQEWFGAVWTQNTMNKHHHHQQQQQHPYNSNREKIWVKSHFNHVSNNRFVIGI